MNVEKFSGFLQITQEILIQENIPNIAGAVNLSGRRGGI